MILSASRRTDIPAFYSSWLINRIREGFVMVRNPMNYHQVSKICLSPNVIDCIVFWTKNATPLLPYLKEISELYPYYFQYTLNPYGKDIEPGLPNLNKKVDVFCQLSDASDPERIIWRYDPILLSKQYPLEWHVEQFSNMVSTLHRYTKKCVISFVDLYDKVKKSLDCLDVHECSYDEMDKLAAAFSKIAKGKHIQLQTCAEKIDFQKYGISHGCCIDASLISQITGKIINGKKDSNQRSECRCIESIDIGQYNTCCHGCKYCYATFNQHSVISSFNRHDPSSPFLIGNLETEDRVTERKMKSLKKEASNQLSMF